MLLFSKLLAAHFTVMVDGEIKDMNSVIRFKNVIRNIKKICVLGYMKMVARY